MQDREPTTVCEDVPDYDAEKYPVLTVDDIPDDAGENLPAEWPLPFAGVICRLDGDGVLLDHVTVELPSGEVLEVKESNSGVSGTFCEGKLIWYWEGESRSFRDWVEQTGAVVKNRDTGEVIDHGSDTA